MTTRRPTTLAPLAAGLICFALAACSAEEPQSEAPRAATETAGAEKIPVTAASEKAVELYRQGRDLAEKLRATDARQLYLQAVAEDPSFALGHFGLATSAPSAKEFFDSLGDAVEAAAGASEGERWLILAAEAGTNGDPETQRDHLTRLAEAYPGDERAQHQLGVLHFGRQEYSQAIARFEQAVAINPDFSPPYNLLGYAQRTLEDYAAAEQAFERYIELLPEEPNPYDSYAELLMKMGRFEESIEAYRKALAKDEHFVASYGGIANNQIFSGRGDEARETLRTLHAAARTDGERRTAIFWTAASYVHEGETAKAVEEARKLYAVAEATGDYSTMSGDLVLMGNILLNAGDPGEAAARFGEAMQHIEQADVTDDVKENARRNQLYNDARVALAGGDVAAARAATDEYRHQVEAKQIPFELRRVHELEGRLHLDAGDGAAALAELQQANQQNPQVLYLQALAHHSAGDAEAARQMATRAAQFNGLNFNFGYVKKNAEEMLAAG